jgi:hypothetical protein
MSTANIIWSLGVTVLLIYFTRIALAEPIGSRFMLWSYWFLFVLFPVVLLGVWMRFTVTAFFPCVVATIGLAAIGERGLRVWNKLWIKK